MTCIRIIYASKDGHAKSVANQLRRAFRNGNTHTPLSVDAQVARVTHVLDLRGPDLLVLVSSEQEGSHYIHWAMYALLFEQAKDIHFYNQHITFVALSKSADIEKIVQQQFQKFLDSHNETHIVAPLMLTGSHETACTEVLAKWVHSVLLEIDTPKRHSAVPTHFPYPLTPSLYV